MLLDSVANASSYSSIASVSTSQCTPDLVARGVDLCWGLGLSICDSLFIVIGNSAGDEITIEVTYIFMFTSSLFSVGTAKIPVFWRYRAK